MDRVRLRRTLVGTVLVLLWLTGTNAASAAGFVVFEDAAHGFRISVPENWTARRDVVLGNESVDVVFFLQGYQFYPANLLVDSDLYAGDESAASAVAELEAVLQDAATLDAFRRATAVESILIGGRHAASVVVTWNPSTWTLMQLVAVVVAAEVRGKWLLIASAATWDFPKFGGSFNESVAGFEVLPLRGVPGLPSTLLIAAILAADSVTAAVVTTIVYRDRRTDR